MSCLGLPAPGSLHSLLPPLAAWDRREKHPVYIPLQRETAHGLGVQELPNQPG